jgi:Ca2+-binding RTX toxin-like protein
VVVNGLRQGPYEASQIVVEGQAGKDVLRAAGKFSKPLELHGGPGNDVLEGGLGPDNLLGGAGNDVLRGGAGNDVLEGGDGRDTLDGQAGSDELFGDGGNDTLIGRKGNDEVHGGEGNDVLHGNDGQDTLHGDGGSDQVLGHGGNDYLAGDDGKDLLDGGAGNDVLVASAGDDRLFGQAGRDLLIGGDGVDWLNGGGQDDVLVAGQTIHEGDAAALNALLARWNGKESYAARLHAINGPSAGSLSLTQANVIDDQDVDRLLGAGGSDFFSGIRRQAARSTPAGDATTDGQPDAAARKSRRRRQAGCPADALRRGESA